MNLGPTDVLNRMWREWFGPGWYEQDTFFSVARVSNRTAPSASRRIYSPSLTSMSTAGQRCVCTGTVCPFDIRTSRTRTRSFSSRTWWYSGAATSASRESGHGHDSSPLARLSLTVALSSSSMLFMGLSVPTMRSFSYNEVEAECTTCTLLRLVAADVGITAE